MESLLGMLSQMGNNMQSGVSNQFSQLMDMFKNKKPSSGTALNPQNTGGSEGATAGDDMGLPEPEKEKGGGSSYVPSSPSTQAVNMMRKARGQVHSNVQPMQRLLSLFSQRR
jgi:hypothetical protein